MTTRRPRPAAPAQGSDRLGTAGGCLTPTDHRVESCVASLLLASTVASAGPPRRFCPSNSSRDRSARHKSGGHASPAGSITAAVRSVEQACVHHHRICEVVSQMTSTRSRGHSCASARPRGAGRALGVGESTSLRCRQSGRNLQSEEVRDELRGPGQQPGVSPGSRSPSSDVSFCRSGPVRPGAGRARPSRPFVLPLNPSFP